MYGCESWTIKKAEHWRIDAFELWCWRRLLRVPWTARRSYQSILKKISPEYSLEGLMLKLKLQYFGHLMQRTDLFEKTLMLGKIDDRRRRGWGGWMSSPTQLLWVWESSRSWWWAGKPSVLQSMGSQRVRHNWATELNWIELNLLQSLDPAVFNSRVSPYWTSSISSIIVCIPTSNSHAFYLLNSDPVAPWGFAGPGETILPVQFSSVQFSCSVVSDSLRPRESQHARPPCPSPTPRVYPNSCPSSRWCHPAMSSSVVPFSSCPQCLPASGSFPMSQLFTWGGQSIGVSASASVLPMNTQDWPPSQF